MLTNKKLIFIFVIIVLVSVIAIFLLHFFTKNDSIAKIYVDDELLYEIDLSLVEKDYTIDLGCGNIVFVSKGRICMESATCPDQICVHQGFIDSGELPIVCLPHKVYISIEPTDSQEVDLVTGGVVQ